MSESIKGTPARLVACCTASTAFAVAVLAGMFAGNTVDSTVTRALAAMAVCYVVGRMVGAAFEAVMAERLRVEAEGPVLADAQSTSGETAGSIGPTTGGTPGVNRTRAA